LESGTFKDDIGVVGWISREVYDYDEVEGNIYSDIDYDFTVLNNRTMSVECKGDKPLAFIEQGIYDVFITNDGFLVSYLDPGDSLKKNAWDRVFGVDCTLYLDGYFYTYTETVTSSMEGVWLENYSETFEGDLLLWFNTYDNGTFTSSCLELSQNDPFDLSILLCEYEESITTWTNSYCNLNDGRIEHLQQVQFSGDEVFWFYLRPIYITDKVAVMGYSYDQDAPSPEFWILQYKLA